VGAGGAVAPPTPCPKSAAWCGKGSHVRWAVLMAVQPLSRSNKMKQKLELQISRR